MLGEAIQTILSLTLIIALIVGLSIMYKKFYFTKYSENAILKINTVLSVGLKEKLVIVECDAKKFLLGITAHSIQLLHVFDGKQEVTERNNP